MSEPQEPPGPPTDPGWPPPPPRPPEAAIPSGWPPAPSSSAPPSPPSGRRSRTGRVVLATLVALAVVGGLATWGLTNRSSAADWRDRSQGTEARLRERVEDLEGTRNELADTEEKLADLASEKANLADKQEVLQEIVADAPDVTAALRDCNDATTEVAAIAIDLGGSPNPDFNLLSDAIDDADLLCAEALDLADELEENIDSLGM